MIAQGETLRAELMEAIRSALERKLLTHAALAEIAGTSRPKITALLNGQRKDASVELVLRILEALGYEAQLVIRKIT